MTPDDLYALSARARELAVELEAAVKPLGSRPQWYAIEDLRAAAARLHSAASWLVRHQEQQR